MDDNNLKAAVEWLRDVVKACPHPDDGQHEKAILAHIDGEPARIAATEWRVAELEDDVADARILLEPHFGQETYQLPLAKTTAGLIGRTEKAEARVEELEAQKVDLKTMIQDLRGRAEKAEARVAELEAQAATDDAHALVVNDAHLKTVAALRRRVAWLEAQWDEAVAALRELFDKGEGCAACGKAERAGCGCRYERARAVLAKYPEAKR